MINHQDFYKTVILLLDKKITTDDGFIRDWLKKSSLMTNEMSDIFQVLEDLSDFTVRSRPNVVLLNVNSLKRDFPVVKNMMSVFSTQKTFPIFALSDCGKVVDDKDCFEGNLAEVQAQLNKLFAGNSRAAALGGSFK